MIAIPVKTNKENTAVSTLFGKAKYFAFIENNKIKILKNEQMGGKAVANWLKNKNVDVLITSHLGEKPLSTLLNNGTKIDVYPMLIIGSGSFARINFQSSGTTNDKFKIIVRKPGTFANPEDPYEKIGYSSIQFWQGTFILRPEWIAKILTGAKA